MKKKGILNAKLAGALATLGHTDLVVIGDCGLPRPAGVRTVDLALVFGVPPFETVVTAIAAEIQIEKAIVATETRTHNEAAAGLLTSLAGEPRWVSHEELKDLSKKAVLFVRTGEATPFANVILQCGVPF